MMSLFNEEHTFGKTNLSLGLQYHIYNIYNTYNTTAQHSNPVLPGANRALRCIEKNLGNRTHGSCINITNSCQKMTKC